MQYEFDDFRSARDAVDCMHNKRIFDRVITVEPTRKNSGPDRRRERADDGPYNRPDKRTP